MKKVFMCSLCHNGLLGGALYLDNESLTYKTNKLTVDKKYKNLVLPRNEISCVTWEWFLFPVATFNMANGEKHKIMIYSKRKFLKSFELEGQK